MKTHTKAAAKSRIFALVILGSHLLLGTGCGDSDSSTDSSDDDGQDGAAINLPVNSIFAESQLQDGKVPFQLQAGQPSQAIFEIGSMVDLFGMGLTDLEFDMGETLKSVTLETAAKPIAQGNTQRATITVRVAPTFDRDNVCTQGELFGTFIVNIENDMQLTLADDSQAPTVDQTPSGATISQAALGVLNRGFFVVCVEVVSPLEGSANLGNLSLTPKFCPTPPANIAGVWTGNYSCQNNPCADEGGEVLMHVSQSQNGYSATYEDDSGAIYDGTVCGNVFRYNGFGPGYSESGVFTLLANGTARKESDWIQNDVACGGQCLDQLERSQQ